MIDDEKSVLDLFNELIGDSTQIKKVENIPEKSIDTLFENVLEDHAINNRYGKWTLIKYSHSDKGKNRLYICKCDCGTIATVRKSRLKNGKSTQCLNCSKIDKIVGLKKGTKKRTDNKRNKFDLNIGNKFNNWTMLEFSHIKTVSNGTQMYYYKFQCDCKNIYVREYNNIIKERSKKCRKCSIEKNLITLSEYASKRVHIFNIGDKYGDREVIGLTNEKKFTHYLVEVKCKCGKIDKIDGSMLKNGRANRCSQCNNELRRLPDPLVGKKYGDRTIIEIIPRITNVEQKVICKCKCDFVSIVRYADLKKGNSNSCLNCSHKENGVKLRRK